MISKIKIVSLLTMLFLTTISDVSACSVSEIPSFAEHLADAKTVFVGRVNSKSINPQEDLVEIIFEVERFWKGQVNKTITVVATTDSCGFAKGGGPSIGEKWLILGGAGPKVGTAALSGNVWLEYEKGRPTGQKIPKLLEKELGLGQVP